MIPITLQQSEQTKQATMAMPLPFPVPTAHPMDPNMLFFSLFGGMWPTADPLQLAAALLPQYKPMFPYKRSYSPMDLEQAVNDVRAGRLGTRKASVVYGIPRSTLRNKVYRLEAYGDKKKLQKSIGKEDTPDSKIDDKSNVIENYNSNDEEGPSTIRLASSPSSSPKSDIISETTLDNVVGMDKRLETEKVQVEDQVLPTPVNGMLPDLFGSAIWSSLFNCDKTFMTSEIMKTYSDLGSAAATAAVANAANSQLQDNGLWRKSRPKRGQYRKYDKSALDQAVNCVRRGEMSVHKAGSIFGVPHSTLEYKVKERNLMKKKKEEERGSTEGNVEAVTPTANPDCSPISE